jgi:outer membrane murein-binding lipoprotein Lpp
MKNIVLTICVMLWVPVLSGCVSPDQYQILENRVNALEMENTRLRQFQNQVADLSSAIEDLEKKVQATGQGSREDIADINQELQQMHKKYAQLQGMMEETAYRLGGTDLGIQTDSTQILDRMDRAISRNHTRITRLETYMGFEPTVPGTNGTDSLKISSTPFRNLRMPAMPGSGLQTVIMWKNGMKKPFWNIRKCWNNTRIPTKQRLPASNRDMPLPSWEKMPMPG